MKHISQRELDKYLDAHKLDLTINMIKMEDTNRMGTETIITFRKTGATLRFVMEGIPDDEDVLNFIKPIMRANSLNSLI